MEQLEENLKAYDIMLEDEMEEKISNIYKQYTDPTKVNNKN
jgi:aryl-alcohol dehydrogenase-like predicted oxidoreductase